MDGIYTVRSKVQIKDSFSVMSCFNPCATALWAPINKPTHTHTHTANASIHSGLGALVNPDQISSVVQAGNIAGPSPALSVIIRLWYPSLHYCHSVQPKTVVNAYLHTSIFLSIIERFHLPLPDVCVSITVFYSSSMSMDSGRKKEKGETGSWNVLHFLIEYLFALICSSLAKSCALWCSKAAPS